MTAHAHELPCIDRLSWEAVVLASATDCKTALNTRIDAPTQYRIKDGPRSPPDPRIKSHMSWRTPCRDESGQTTFALQDRPGLGEGSAPCPMPLATCNDAPQGPGRARDFRFRA